MTRVYTHHDSLNLLSVCVDEFGGFAKDRYFSIGGGGISSGLFLSTATITNIYRTMLFSPLTAFDW